MWLGIVAGASVVAVIGWLVLGGDDDSVATPAAGASSSSAPATPGTSGTEDSTPTTPPTTAETGASTTEASTSSTVSETTTSTAVPGLYGEFLDDPDAFLAANADALEGIPDDPLGGSPSYRAAAAFADELEQAGFDLTELEIWVWPVSGTGDTLLILAAGPTTPLLEDDAGADSLVEMMLSSPALADAGVTRMALVFESADAQGPFSVTYTVALDALRSALAEGRDLSADEVVVQMTREG